MDYDSWRPETHLEHTHREAVDLFLSVSAAIDDGFTLAATRKRAIIVHLWSPADSNSVPLPYAYFTCEKKKFYKLHKQNENPINFQKQSILNKFSLFLLFLLHLSLFIPFFLSFFLLFQFKHAIIFTTIASHISYWYYSVLLRVVLTFFAVRNDHTPVCDLKY